MAINVTNVMNKSMKIGANKPLPLLLIGGAALLLFATQSCKTKPEKPKEAQIIDLKQELKGLEDQLYALEERKQVVTKEITQIAEYLDNGRYEDFHRMIAELNELYAECEKVDCMSYNEATLLRDLILSKEKNINRDLPAIARKKSTQLGKFYNELSEIESKIKYIHQEKQNIEQQLQALCSTLNISA